MILKLKNNTTKVEYEFEVADKMNSQLFYSCDIRLFEGMLDGEYTYELYEFNGEFLATGLIQIGEYVRTPKNEYNGGKKEYKIYGK